MSSCNFEGVGHHGQVIVPEVLCENVVNDQTDLRDITMYVDD